MTLRGDLRALTREGDATFGDGRVFFVDSNNGASGNSGTSVDYPKATIAQALDLCTADRGDVIVCLPNHAETVTAAGGIDLDVAGVKVVGLGKGTAKPAITIGTATTADVLVSAEGVTLKGFKLTCDINDLGMMLDVNEGAFTIEDCDFVTSSAKEAFCFIDLADTKDDFVVRNCTFLQPTDPEGTGGNANTGAIYCQDSENIVVEGCRFNGNFESGIIHNKTTACKRLVVKDCELVNNLTVPFLLVAGATGSCVGCWGETVTATDATEALVYGTIGTRFWIHTTTALGNDSGAGGQGGITGTVAS